MITNDEVRHKIRNMDVILIVTDSDFKIIHVEFFKNHSTEDESINTFIEAHPLYINMNINILRLSLLKGGFMLEEIVDYLRKNPYLLPGNLPKDQWTPWQHEIYRRDPLVQFHADINNFSTTLELHEIKEVIDRYGE